MRIGTGYDVHRLVENRDLIIGGVKIPYVKGLLGHSDADVLIHAVMDALLGAGALGDIGLLFPDSDDRYKGISSVELLRHVREVLEENFYMIENIDCTIIAQAPKMRPHIDAMRKNMAEALQIDVGQVSVKATTEEGLGFTGSGEGIAAQAVALLTSPREFATLDVTEGYPSNQGGCATKTSGCAGCSGCSKFGSDAAGYMQKANLSLKGGKNEMNEQYDGLIFDVDGTLWDSTPIVEKAWNQALIDFGYPQFSVTADRLKGLFGLPMADIINAIMPGVPEEKRKEFEPMCFSYEHEYLEREAGILYPELGKALELLAKKYPLAIVSNCQAGYIELFLKKTGFGDLFVDHQCPGDEPFLLKADNIKLIAERNGMKNPLYIGDTQMDANACKAAGVPIMFCAYGFGTVEEPDYVVNSPMEWTEKLL